MSWRGVFAGVLGLVALEAILRTDASARRFGGMFTAVGQLVESFMSPDVPAIPDLAGVGTAPGPAIPGDGGAGNGGGNGGGGNGGGGGGGNSW